MRRTTARVAPGTWLAMLNRPEACERHGLGHATPAAPRVRLMRAMGLHGHRPCQIAQDDPVGS